MVVPKTPPSKWEMFKESLIINQASSLILKYYAANFLFKFGLGFFPVTHSKHMQAPTDKCSFQKYL